MAESVETEQGTIVYSVTGEGAPLVLLPGFMSNRTGWLAPTNYIDLLDGFQVINIDPLGHGKSTQSHDHADYTAQLVVDHVVAVLDEVGIDSAHVWGFSRGGMIAALMTELVPERCRSITMAATPLGGANTSVLAQISAGEPLLAEGDWDSYWELYPLPLPKFLTDFIEKSNDHVACAAVIRGMVRWQRQVPGFGLRDTGVPRFAFFGSGESFADELRDELKANDVPMYEGEWKGHAETMLDAAGAVQLFRNFVS